MVGTEEEAALKRKIRAENAKLRRRWKLANEDDETRQRRLQKCREYMIRVRAAQLPEEREARLEQARLRMSQLRAALTPEQREARLESARRLISKIRARRRMPQAKAAPTPEQHEAQLESTKQHVSQASPLMPSSTTPEDIKENGITIKTEPGISVELCDTNYEIDIEYNNVTVKVEPEFTVEHEEVPIMTDSKMCSRQIDTFLEFVANRLSEIDDDHSLQTAMYNISEVLDNARRGEYICKKKL